jgi:membrane fusion protein (multidrug efflux system)
MSRFVYLSLLLAACADSAAAPSTNLVPPATKVDAFTATAAPTPDVLTLTGKVVADQRAEITADTQGKVIAVLVERGQHVRRGQPVLRLDVRSAALSARESIAHLEAARSDRQLADLECERTRSLFAKGAISRSELDRQNAHCTSAEQQVSAARARSAMLAKSVSDGIVRAPFDGVVSERAVNTGEWVAPGRSLLTLVDSDPLRVELSVPEASVPAVALGQQVSITTVARPDHAYHAEVTRRAAEIGRSRSLIVEATLTDSAPALVPGMFVESQLIVGHSERPVIPSTAVARRGKTWHAFVIANGVVEERIVQLGPVPSRGRVSILQNLQPGERVVSRITDQIVDGLRVE